MEKSSEITRERAKPKKKPLRKRKVFKFIFFLTIILLTAVILLTSPVFDVKTIKVSGNTTVSESYILKQGELLGKINIFLLSGDKIEKLLKENPYIRSADIIKKYPDEININIRERKVRGFIEYKPLGSFLHVDETGTVIDVTKSVTENKPLIIGLSYIDFAIGEPIKFDNSAAFENVVILDKLFEKYELSDVLKFDISSPSEIHILMRGVDITFGNIENADLKVRRIKAIMAEIPVEYKGYLDVSDIEKDTHVFSYLK